MSHTDESRGRTLAELDELLARVRRLVRSPGYRSALLAGQDVPGGISALRLLRGVAVLSADGPPAIKDVANHLALEHSTTSRAVDAAARAGLLAKESCSSDQRRIRLELTSAGAQLLEETTTRRVAILDRATSTWPDDAIGSLTQLLARLCDDFDTAARS